MEQFRRWTRRADTLSKVDRGSEVTRWPSSPPAGSDEQDGTDFLASQTVFGTGYRPAAGIDVLATKAALDFQALTSESGDNCVKRNLDALREATGVDAICIALFDPEKKVVERVASATGLFTPFDPQVLKGDSRVAHGHLRDAERSPLDVGQEALERLGLLQDPLLVARRGPDIGGPAGDAQGGETSRAVHGGSERGAGTRR